MTRFAFVIHPIHARDAARKYPWMKLLPGRVIERLMNGLRLKPASHITGIKSLQGVETEGWFMGLPATPRMLLAAPDKWVDGIVELAKQAQDLGAEVIGLGAYSAIIGDSGLRAAERSPIAMTTGNSYTVATAMEGAMIAANRVGIEPMESTLAVVGAGGSIGRTCALGLAPLFRRTILVGRTVGGLEKVAGEIPRAETSIDPYSVLQADVVVTVTSSESAVIEPRHLKPGSVVCDVSRPRDVSVRVVRERPDVLVIEGGIVKVPGPVEFNFDFGFPVKTAYACMSETMLLALEGRAESYTLGKEVSLEQVEETTAWAKKHGFELAGFRAFEREVTEDRFATVRRAREGLPVREAVR